MCPTEALFFHPPLHQPEKGAKQSENKSCATNQNSKVSFACGAVQHLQLPCGPLLGNVLGWTWCEVKVQEQTGALLVQSHQGHSGLGPRLKLAVRLAVVNRPWLMAPQGWWKGLSRCLFVYFLICLFIISCTSFFLEKKLNKKCSESKGSSACGLHEAGLLPWPSCCSSHYFISLTLPSPGNATALSAQALREA